MFRVYALYNAEVGRIYIGQTNNIEARLIEHNNKRGNHYTAKFVGKWELIYSEPASSRSEALRREKQLKSANGRAFIKKYIPKE